MNEQALAELLVECLDRMEQDWWQIDSEWGPSEGGLDGDIAKGYETLIPRVREAIIQLASKPMAETGDV